MKAGRRKEKRKKKEKKKMKKKNKINKKKRKKVEGQGYERDEGNEITIASYMPLIFASRGQ